MKTRREFIADTCKLCAVIATAGVAASFLESCNTVKVITADSATTGQLEVPLTSFAEQSQVIVRSKKTDFGIFVNRKADNTYTALKMECTHEAQPLTASGKSLYCSSHGSKFDLEGNVVLAPATKNLLRYPVSTTETNLIIQLKTS